MRRSLALFCAAALTWTETDARAEKAGAAKLVITMDPTEATLAARIGQELATMDIDSAVILRAQTIPAGLPSDVTMAAREIDADVRISETKVEVRLLDRKTGKTLHREGALLEAAEDASRALHVVELLRAGLLELELPADFSRPRSTGEPPNAGSGTANPVSAPQSGAEGAAPQTLLTLELGPSIVAGMGDLGMYPALLAAANLSVSRRLGVGALGWIPLQPMRHQAVEGSSKTRVTILGIEARYLTRGWIRFESSFGFTLCWLNTRGSPQGLEFTARQDDAFTLGAMARAGLAVSLGWGLSISPKLGGGAQSRDFSIDYAARQAARWGPLWWTGTLALEAEFPR